MSIGPCDPMVAQLINSLLNPWLQAMTRKVYPNVTLVFAQGQPQGYRWISPAARRRQDAAWTQLWNDYNSSVQCNADGAHDKRHTCVTPKTSTLWAGGR